MSDLSKIGAYSASLAMSLNDQGKEVVRMLEAGQNKVDVAKNNVTDTALQELQRANAAKEDLIKVGAKLDIFA
jgi:RNA-binding protein YhbY